MAGRDHNRFTDRTQTTALLLDFLQGRAWLLPGLDRSLREHGFMCDTGTLSQANPQFFHQFAILNKSLSIYDPPLPHQ